MRVGFFTLFVISVFLISCNNKNESTIEPKSESSIVGEWHLHSWYDDVPRDINKDGLESTDLLSQWNGCKKKCTLRFNWDHTAEFVYQGASQNPRCPPGFKKGSLLSTEPWAIENNVLVFKGDDYSDRYEILVLTQDELVLKGAGFVTCCDASISYFEGGYLRFEK